MWKSWLWLLLFWWLAGCSPAPLQSQLYQIYQRDSLKVGILHGPTSYYVGVDGPVGFELELSQALADKLGVKLELYPSYHLEELLQKLDSGQVDYIAGGLTVTQIRKDKYRASPAYRWINEVLVFKQGNIWPRSLNELSDSIIVVKDSSHAETLQQLSQDTPELNWQQHPTLDADEILQQVVDGNIAYTLTDSNQLALNRRFYPNLSIAFTVRDNLPVSWLIAANNDDSLYAVLIEFFGAMYQSGELIALEDRYFGHVQQFDYVDTLAYIEAIEQNLPTYKPWFVHYAGELDWRLLAALSYQESHWDPKAKSPTGVRGLMMLTLPTAQQMGISSRLDPEQSIRGGSRYLHRLVSRIPERIAMPDRLWFALASYNVGWGHVEDARILTQRDGADPDKWLDVKQRLPLLRQKSVYQTTKYGYARGDEAVSYVENIRRYYDTLLWVDERQQAELRLEQQKKRLTEQLSSENSTEILPTNDDDGN
ncbi:membrane-bound lytic murein transglycosylase MltF [Rheinheimera maricola]|uniref:Membrane-bound lytic murein transglycosylase F n=1 Tax=Rheinheimera maricola TaxID=2793282 RepID=A0ABS7XAC0_9GAMM|nr:membrane-bound lytic murein transglycosylase MltF [Rheinheimera maricola]MBZ9612506.1 membrane-bound lytic murein transglycosylase MltF [Rheinheimera maricola]